MRRDENLIREMLLKLESFDKSPSAVLIMSEPKEDLGLYAWSDDAVDYHFTLLREAGLVEDLGPGNLSGGHYFRRLTWAGHDFVDAVRDPEIWKKTISTAQEVQGFTIDVLKELAKGLIKTKIKQHTGVDI